MTIELLTPELHKELQDIQNNNPNLTFQNEGYKYINKDILTDSDNAALLRIAEILKNHIKGFSEFNNFIFDKKGNLNLRFQYDYNHDTKDRSFIGVGYIELNELLNGFNN